MNKMKRCDICQGAGKVKIADYIRLVGLRNILISCPACEGDGLMPDIWSVRATAISTDSVSQAPSVETEIKALEPAVEGIRDHTPNAVPL